MAVGLEVACPQPIGVRKDVGGERGIPNPNPNPNPSPSTNQVYLYLTLTLTGMWAASEALPRRAAAIAYLG